MIATEKTITVSPRNAWMSKSMARMCQDTNWHLIQTSNGGSNDRTGLRGGIQLTCTLASHCLG